MQFRLSRMFSNIILIAVIVIFSVFLVRGQNANGAIIDRILAIVSNDIITLSDLLVREKLLYKMEKPPDDLSEESKIDIREKMLQDLIDERLMIAEARRLGLAPSDTEVNEFLNDLKIENNMYSDEEFERYLSEDGLTPEDIKRKISDDKSIAKVRERMIYYNVEVSEEEIVDYYEREWTGYKEGVRVKISHILLNIPEGATTEDERHLFNKAEEIMKKYREGRAFSDLAARYSEDEDSANSGGDLGMFYVKDLIPEFATAIGNLEVGNVTGPIKTTLGFHILLLEERKSEGLEKGSSIWNAIGEMLYEKKKADFLETWIKRLRQEASIDIKQEALVW